jgi:hypothetical protein
MVSRTPTIRPSQLSTLKALNSLDEEDERGENDDRQTDIKEIQHRNS